MNKRKGVKLFTSYATLIYKTKHRQQDKENKDLKSYDLVLCEQQTIVLIQDIK